MTRLGLLLLLTAMCALSAPVAAAGQRASGGHGQRKPPPPPVVTAPPSLNRPSFVLEGLNRPAFEVAGPLGIGQPSPFAAHPGTFAPRVPRTNRSHGPRAFGIPLGGYGFGTPGYYGDPSAGYADNYAAAVAERSATDESAAGILFLDATPHNAQVFIDSAFVGTVDDLFSNGVRLGRGRHWLELEAPEFEKKLVEVSITPGQPLRYRADLSPVRRAALAVIPPRLPETMYAIPGCYGGNKPPVASALPAGCDIANVRVIRPQKAN